jgi:hypothetical protein
VKIRNARLVCNDCNKSFSGSFTLEEIGSVGGLMTGKVVEACGEHHFPYSNTSVEHNEFTVFTGGEIGNARIPSIGSGAFYVTNKKLREKMIRFSSKERR